MKRSAVFGMLITLGLSSCEPKPPEAGGSCSLPCPPYGKHEVAIQFSSQFSPPSTTHDSSDRKCFAWLIKNWSSLWPKVDAEFRKIATDYQYGATIKELLSDSNNILGIEIGEGETKDRPFWIIRLEIKLPEGRHIFQIWFDGDTIVDSQPMF